MGGNKTANKNNELVNTNLQNNQQAGNKTAEDIGGQEKQTGDQAEASRGGLTGQISNVAAKDYSTNYQPDLSKSNAAYQGFLGNGGVDESKLGGGNATLSDQQNNSAIADRFRANGTYDEFAKTGGMSAGDVSNVRGRIASQVPAYYNAMKQQGQQAQMAAGGYNPGAAAAMNSRNARQAAAGSADAVRNGEIDLRNTINQGRMFGAQGMTSAEGNLQGMRQGAAVNQNNDQARTQGMVQQGKMFGASGVNNNEQFAGNMGYNQSQANMNRQVGQDNTVLGADAELYGGDRDYMGNLMNARINNQATTQSGTGQATGQLIQNNPRKDYLGQIIGGAAGVAGAWAGNR